MSNDDQDISFIFNIIVIAFIIAVLVGFFFGYTNAFAMVEAM